MDTSASKPSVQRARPKVVRRRATGNGGKRPPKRKNLRRYSAWAAVVVLLAIAILLFFELERLTSPPLTPKAGKTPATNSARAVWRYSLYGAGIGDTSQFFFPYQAAVDRKGRIFVSDTGNSRILYFDKNRKFLGELKGTSDGKITFDEPLGMTFSPSGDLYIADRGISKVVILDRKFKLKHSFAEAIPINPVIGPDGRLYVTTYDSIAIHTMDGDLLGRWGKRGRAMGEFDFPNGLTFSLTGTTAYVSDSNNHRLQALDLKGKPLWSVGRPVNNMNERPIEFDLPAGIARDEEGFLYLADTFDNSIRILNARGEEVAVIGDYGTEDGLFSYPVTITYAGDHRFLISDRGNGRIQALDIFPPGNIAVGKPGDKPGTASAIEDKPAADLMRQLAPAILLLLAALFTFAAAMVLRRGRNTE